MEAAQCCYENLKCRYRTDGIDADVCLGILSTSSLNHVDHAVG